MNIYIYLYVQAPRKLYPYTHIYNVNIQLRIHTMNTYITGIYTHNAIKYRLIRTHDSRNLKYM